MVLWLVYSVFSQAGFATGNICDKVLRSRLSTFSLFIAGGLSSILGLAFFLFSGSITAAGVVLSLAAGVAWYLAAIPYYHSLSLDEVSRVAPLWLLQVPFTLILSLVFLKDKLTPQQYIALLLIFAGSFAISAKKFRDVFRLSPVLFFMALASLLVSVAVVLSKHVYIASEFWAVQAVMFLGSFAAATFILLLSSRRKRFFSDVRKCSRQVLLLWVSRQFVATAALTLFNLAVLTGPVTIVVALSGLASFFVFTAASVITKIRPSLMQEDLGWKNLLTKAVSIAMISAGAALAAR